MKKSPFHANSGFTLLELLVTVVILSVLAALLFPIRAMMIEKSEATKCVANLRNIGQAALLYAAENQNNLVPYRIDPVGDPAGFWWDHLHEFVGRDRGRSGAYVDGILVRYPGFNCPASEDRRYHINLICGWNDGSRTIPVSYLKLGQGCIQNERVFELPGGAAKTAWFACPSASGGAFQPERFRSDDNFFGFLHGKTANVLFMDGHIENVPDPDFANNPELLDDEKWIHFFGHKRRW